MGSSFVHLIRTDSNEFFLMAIYLFIFGLTGSLLPGAGFLWLWLIGATLWFMGFSLQGLLLLQSTGSRRVDSVVAHRLSWPEACGISVHPWPGIKPMSPALADGFLTTGPAGKSFHRSINILILLSLGSPGRWAKYFREVWERRNIWQQSPRMAQFLWSLLIYLRN